MTIGKANPIRSADDLIKRDDALAAIDMALNNATGDLFDCHAAIRALPAVASATLTPNSVDDSKTANPVVNDPAAIRALQARIEELVKEVDRRIEPEQVEKLIMLADPIMSELYAVECSYRQEAEAKLAKAVEALNAAVKWADRYRWAAPWVDDAHIALAELEGK